MLGAITHHLGVILVALEPRSDVARDTLLIWKRFVKPLETIPNRLVMGYVSKGVRICEPLPGCLATDTSDKRGILRRKMSPSGTHLKENNELRFLLIVTFCVGISPSVGVRQ